MNRSVSFVRVYDFIYAFRPTHDNIDNVQITVPKGVKMEGITHYHVTVKRSSRTRWFCIVSFSVSEELATTSAPQYEMYDELKKLGTEIIRGNLATPESETGFQDDARFDAKLRRKLGLVK
jgi:hypothetical protein